LNNPQTIHKYVFVVNNPINLVDPFGLKPEDPTEIGKMAHRTISKLYEKEHKKHIVTYGKGIPGLGNYILPDIMDYTISIIGEIKPAKDPWWVDGPYQARSAIKLANGIEYSYKDKPLRQIAPVPNDKGEIKPWTEMTWDPGVTVLYPDLTDPRNLPYKDYVVITILTKESTLFYTTEKREDDVDPPKIDIPLLIQKYTNYRQDIIYNQRELYDYETWKEQLRKTLPDVGVAAAVTVAAVSMLYLDSIIVINCGMPSLAFA
jgi:hypothetical protein